MSKIMSSAIQFYNVVEAILIKLDNFQLLALYFVNIVHYYIQNKHTLQLNNNNTFVKSWLTQYKQQLPKKNLPKKVLVRTEYKMYEHLT